MQPFKNKTYRPDIFRCMKILQYISRLFGMSYHKTGFGLNFDSLVFVAAAISYGGCIFAVRSCWTNCNRRTAKKSIVILMGGVRLVQLGVLLCIIRFGFSNEKVSRMLHFGNRLNEKNHEFISLKYHRRSLVILTLFWAWILSKAIQLIDITVMDMGQHTKQSYSWRYACTFLHSWPLMILTWQFLVWMQFFSRGLKLSLDKLGCAIVKAQEAPNVRHEIQIIESIASVKVVLKLKKKILDIYGLSVLLNQLRATIWIIMNAYWYSFTRYRSRLVYLTSIFVLNTSLSFLPHWVGQDISSESAEMVHKVLRMQVTGESLIIDKKLSNFLFGFLHENQTFRVCGIFNLNHKQYLSHLSLSIGFLIVQLQMIDS